MDIVSILLAAASVGSAQAGDSAQAQQVAQPEERRICRRVRGSSASRMGPRRICKTAAEWAATASNADTDVPLEDGMDPLSDIPTTGCTGGRLERPTAPH